MMYDYQGMFIYVYFYKIKVNKVIFFCWIVEGYFRIKCLSIYFGLF